jgi:uncharacterized phage-associated protein
MHLHFHFDKALQAAGVLLDFAGGRMEYLRLLKLLYIAEREMIAEACSPITGDRAVSMKHGPVLSQVYDLIKGNSARSGEWSHYVSTVSPDVVQNRPIPRGKLNTGEIEKLRAVSDRFHGVSVWDICDVTHTFAEWQQYFADEKSKTIPWEDVLRAQGKADKISVVMEEERLRREFDSVFGWEARVE